MNLPALIYYVVLVLVCIQPSRTTAQSTEEMAWIINTMARLCVLGGDSFGIQAAGEGDLAVRSISADGTVEGQFQIQNSRVEGLVEGIGNSLSQVAADQASEARRCLEPLRTKLLEIFFVSNIRRDGNAQQDAPPAMQQGTPAAIQQTVSRPIARPGNEKSEVVANPIDHTAPVSTAGESDEGSVFSYRKGGINEHEEGFACSKAAMPMDFVICSFQEVYDINTQHAVAWWATMDRLTRRQKDELIGCQKQWISEMISSCNLPPSGKPSEIIARNAAYCVYDQYAKRINYVRAF